jgi:hypothetical protein
MSSNISSTDLTNWKIDWNDIADIAICRHELIHTKMFMTTVYGGYQLLIKKLLEFTERNSEFYNQLLIGNYELYKQSKNAHEIVATYCSIKQLDSELIEPYVKTLPKEYLKYYSILSQKLDKSIKSTFLQYLVGELIGVVCFNSGIDDEIKSNLKSYNLKITNKNSPNVRLEMLINKINEKDIVLLLYELQEILSKNIQEIRIKEGFDIQVEKDWKDLEGTQIIEINNLLGDFIYKFLVDFLEKQMGFSCVPVESGRKGLSELINSFDQSLALKLINEFSGNSLEINGLKQSEEDILGNKYINDSLITNKVRFPLREVDPEGVLIFNGSGWRRLSEQSLIHLDKEFNFDKNEVWAIVKTQQKDYEFSAGCITKEMYLTILNNRGAPGVPSTKIDAHIMGVTASSNTDTITSIESKITDNIKSVCQDITSFQLSRTNKEKNLYRHYEPRFKNIVWYMHGDFVPWFNFMLSFKKLKFFVMKFKDENATNNSILSRGSKLSESVYFGALVFYSDMLPGMFMRVYNINTYELVMSRIMPFVDSEKIKVDDDSKRRFYEKQAIRSFKVIESVWDNY